jgi:PAS domain S-box-containing protein
MMAELERPYVEDLESRLQFETLISNTSASLSASAPEALDLAIERTLQQVREFFEADRCALLAVAADQSVVNVRLASYGEGVSHVPSDANLVPMFPWAARKLLVERLPIRISRLADLPPEADADRPGWIQMQTRSSLVLPIETGADVRHMIVIQSVREEREWPDAFMTRLRVLGELIVGALERREMLVGIREAEARLSMAAESAELGLWVLDWHRRTLWATRKVRAALGCPPDEVLTLARFESSIHPEDRVAVVGAIEHAMRARAPLDQEYRILRQNGSVRWIALRGRPQSTSPMDSDRLMGVLIDVTERKLADDALRRTEARLASGAALAGLAYYEMDYGEGVAYVDDRLRELLGIDPEPESAVSVLAHWSANLHPEDSAHVLEMRRQLHYGTIDEISIEYRFLHPVRGQCWVHHLARVAQRDASGQAIIGYGVIRDITKRKLADQQLRDLSQRLIQAQEQDRALLARDLHDDVTQRLAVLAIDVGRAELAATDAAQAARLRAVRDGLVRLSEDVHSLAYQLHPSVLVELGLAEALRTESERFGRRCGVELSLDLDPVPEGLGRDAALCAFRVAQEALNNVARHAGAHAASVTLRAMDRGMLLAVRDDGIGFDPASPGASRTLGLASMRERVRAVGGTLDIESAPGQGTAVFAWVPGHEASQ